MIYLNSKNEWEKIYSQPGYRNKNKYPFDIIISVVNSRFDISKSTEKIKILELGSGWGNNLKFFRDIGANYLGIEQSITAVEHCNDIGLKAKHDNFVSFDYPINFYDLIIDRQSLQHNNLESINSVVKSVHSSLKKNGLFFSQFVISDNYKVQTTYLQPEEYESILSNFSSVSINIHSMKEFNSDNSASYMNVLAVK